MKRKKKRNYEQIDDVYRKAGALKQAEGKELAEMALANAENIADRPKSKPRLGCVVGDSALRVNRF